MIEIIPNWHPIFVHFTIALLSISTVFYLLAFLLTNHRWKEQWLTVANWNLWLGTVFAVATGIAGWFAYNSVAHDAPSHAAMTDHRNWAFATLAVFIPLGIWSFWQVLKNRMVGKIFLILMLVASAMLTSTAWRGGEIVYRYGLGVLSMPKVSSPAQGHGHDDMATVPRKADDGHQHSHQ